VNKQLSDELKSFASLWGGGYFEGDPLNPLARSTYGPIGYLSVLHATYLRCIKPYVDNHTIALEIGPGRGAWTKALLGAKEVYALDALPEQHNRFFEYLGHPKNVKYFQVEDFRCAMLPNNHFDYMFSFGCLCHVSFEGITEYAKHIFRKLRHGSNCFWMIADFDRYNRVTADAEKFNIWDAVLRGTAFAPFLRLFHVRRPRPLDKARASGSRKPGHWCHAGIERTCAMLEKTGYRILDPDVGTVPRDPIIHFTKP
jgi:phospholipid N-methyltransferase